ncbi:MAG: hypothetical protein MUD03_17470 [Pirellula sp.]|nr:hypothetical protein [Pirellula sp.]
MTRSVFRRTPVALLNLLAHPTRAIVSLGGVSFALLLIFMQLGFRGAVGNTATIVYGKMSGDLVVRSLDYVHLYEPKTIDRHWLKTLASHPMVERVDPFFIMLQKWQNPPRNNECIHAPPDGSFRTVGMMGVEFDHPVLQVPGILSQMDALKDPDSMLVDEATRAEYGPQDCKRFGSSDVGQRLELGGRSTRIAGTFRLGTGLATNGAVLVSDVAFSRRAPFDTRSRVSLGLIHLREEVDPAFAAKELTNWLSQLDAVSNGLGETSMAQRNPDRHDLHHGSSHLLYHRCGDRLHGVGNRRRISHIGVCNDESDGILRVVCIRNRAPASLDARVGWIHRRGSHERTSIPTHSRPLWHPDLYDLGKDDRCIIPIASDVLLFGSSRHAKALACGSSLLVLSSHRALHIQRKQCVNCG